MAFINNLVEIRSDAYKFVHVYRRPTPRPCESIGTWFYVMEIMTFAAVTTNCANIFLVSEFADRLNWPTRIFGLFIAEHFFYALKAFIAGVIPDVSGKVQRQIDYEEHFMEKFLEMDRMNSSNADFADEIGLYRDNEATFDTPSLLNACRFEFTPMSAAPASTDDAVVVELEDEVCSEEDNLVVEDNPVEQEGDYRKCFELFLKGDSQNINTRDIAEALLKLGSPHSDGVELEDEQWNTECDYEMFAAAEVPMDERPVNLAGVRALLAAGKN